MRIDENNNDVEISSESYDDSEKDYTKKISQ